MTSAEGFTSMVAMFAVWSVPSYFAPAGITAQKIRKFLSSDPLLCSGKHIRRRVVESSRAFRQVPPSCVHRTPRPHILLYCTFRGENMCTNSWKQSRYESQVARRSKMKRKIPIFPTVRIGPSNQLFHILSFLLCPAEGGEACQLFRSSNHMRRPRQKRTISEAPPGQKKLRKWSTSFPHLIGEMRWNPVRIYSIALTFRVEGPIAGA